MYGDLPRRWGVLGMVALLVLHAAITILWLHEDTRPPAWDRANHAERAFRCSEILASPSPDSLGRLFSVSGHYPPLVHCVAGALYLVAPASELSHQGIIYAFLAAVLIATYAVGTRLHGRVLGLIAGGIVTAAPFVQVESRAFMLDIPLTAFVTLSYVAVLRSARFTRFGPSLAVGLLTGLGMLAKWTVPIYTLPVCVVTLCQDRKRGPRTRVLACVGTAVVAATVIAAPWYLWNLLAVVGGLLSTSFKSGAWEGDPPVFSLASALYYPAGLVPQVGLVATVLFFIGLVLLARSGRAGLPALAAWLGPLFFFTLLRNKDLRFTLPLIPAVALIAAHGLLRLRPFARGLAAGLLIACSIWQVLAAGFGVLPVRGILLPGLPLLVADPARREHWPVDELLDLIVADSGGRPVSVTVVPDYPEFSRSNFRYAAVLRGLPYRFGRAWEVSPLGFEYIVLKTGRQGPEFSTEKARRVMQDIAARRRDFERVFQELGRLPLPTGDEAVLLKRNIQPVLATREEIETRLRSTVTDFLTAYARHVDRLRVEITASEEDLRTGRIERLGVSAAGAELGDFRRKPASLAVANIHVEFDGFVFNPHLLLEQGRLELLDLGAVTLRHARVTEDAVRAYLHSDPKLHGLEVSLDSGSARVDMRRGMLQSSATISAQTEQGLLRLGLREASLWGLRVPPAAAERLLTRIDLERQLSALPVRLRLGNLSLLDGQVVVD